MVLGANPDALDEETLTKDLPQPLAGPRSSRGGYYALLLIRLHTAF